jgi:hypothetical protein
LSIFYKFLGLFIQVVQVNWPEFEHCFLGSFEPVLSKVLGIVFYHPGPHVFMQSGVSPSTTVTGSPSHLGAATTVGSGSSQFVYFTTFSYHELHPIIL